MLAVLILCLSFGIFLWARYQWGLPLGELQTLVFVMLVFAGQGTVYLVRERARFWNSRPSRWLLTSTAADLVVVCFLATRGVLMAPISLTLVLATLGLVALY